MAPIEMAMSNVLFTPIANTETDRQDSSIPYATHTGILKIGEIEIEVCQLNDGRRIIATDAMTKVFGEGWQELLKK